MEKKRVVLALVLVLLLAMFTSTAMGTLTMDLLDLTGGDVVLNDLVKITVISVDETSNTRWGVYLNPTSDYGDGYAQLESPAVNAGNTGASGAVESATDPAAGHDYKAWGGGISTGEWSTVNFRGLSVGTYTVELTRDAGSTGTLLATADITVVPEPSTVALLGLGGLFLLRRRR